MSAHDEAVARIRQAKETGAEVLDLGDLGLERLPEELGELTALQVLSLGEHAPHWEDGELRTERGEKRPARQITNLWPLASLTGLLALDLSACNGVVDLRPLTSLTSLRHLDLGGCEGVVDVSPLAKLASLQFLHLDECSELTDVSPLANLTSLDTLILARCKKVEGVGPLASLASLTTLILFDCAAVVDVNPLAKLTSLQSLYLSGCDGLVDLRPLAKLSSLRSLMLGSKGVEDVSPLTSLTSLQSLRLTGCDRVVDISPLAKLVSLEHLSLFLCEGVADVSLLTKLTSLLSLNLSWCARLVDISPLASLTSLQSLDLQFCRGLTSFAPLVPLLPHLKVLRIFGSHFKDLSPELYEDSPDANVIDPVRAHFADLDHAFTIDPELKLFILGNGGVGKTQLCNRLRDLPFAPSVPSTHGILSHDIPLSVPGFDEPVRLHLLDFGGQDVYHGSHSLFLHAHAITLLLWHPDRENGFWEEPNSNLRFKQRPLSYWLDYVRGLIGTEDPLLVIQSHCDKTTDRHPTPGWESHNPPRLYKLTVSARTGFGLTSLRGAIEEAAAAVLERRPRSPIGRVRLAVRDRLRRLREADQALPQAERRYRTLTRQQFATICNEAGGVASVDALLYYFHQTGVVFYRSSLSDRIIVDLSWAFEAVYALLHRTDTLPALQRMRGRFTHTDLRSLTVWQNYTFGEQRLFLDVMVECGICFAIRRDEQEMEYVAPELLPEWSAVQREVLGPLQHKKSAVQAEVRYRYLYEGIQRAFLSQVGSHAEDAALYWKYGLWLYDARTDSQVLVESTLGDNVERPGEGTFTFQAWGREPARLIESLLQTLRFLPMAHAPEITRHGYDPAHLDQHEPHELQATTPPATPDNREVFISYAWGDNASDLGQLRDAVVDRLCERLRSNGYQPMRDKEQMRPGDLISAFMKRIGKGGRVVMVLSGKYLLSEYCMTEMLLLLQDCKGDLGEFRERVKAVAMGEAGIDDREARGQCADFWLARSATLQATPRHRLGPHDEELLTLLRRWSGDIAGVLDTVRMVVCSRLAGPADIERGVADVLAMFRQQS